VRPTAHPPSSDAPPTNGSPGAKVTPLSREERRRAASRLTQHYAKGQPSERLVAAPEVLLGTAATAADPAKHHPELVEARRATGNERGIFAHLMTLVRLEPADRAARTAFIEVGDRVGEDATVVEVLLAAAESCADTAQASALMVDAAIVCRDRLDAAARAI